jgi:hypothetical protein
MDIARLLTEGVGSWLNFEWCCDRSGLFNEKYLSVPVGQILAGRYGVRVHAEFKHPVLALANEGLPGRRPEVDFAVCDPYPTVKVAVETKWIGPNLIDVKDIIWDLIRLELIANNSNATCIFLLAGTRRNLSKLFSSAQFAGPPEISFKRPILNVKSNSQHGLWLVPQDQYRVPILQKLFKSLQDQEVPHKILTRRTAPFPSDNRINQYQVYSWIVRCMIKRKTFIPKESPRYRILTPLDTSSTP